MNDIILFFKSKTGFCLTIFVMIVLISLSWGGTDNFLKYFSVLVSLLVGFSYFISMKEENMRKILEIEKNRKEEEFEKEERYKELSAIIGEQDQAIKEQEEILTQYVELLDAVEVKIPCVCGKGSFTGLFSANTDNIVQCDKCENRFRIDITYNPVLLSEPLDLNQKFDELVADFNELKLDDNAT